MGSSPATKAFLVLYHQCNSIFPGFINLRMALPKPTIQIQQLDSIPQMKALERLQQEVWGWSELDVTPLMDFIILKELGGTLIGGFDGERLVGFAFGFVGYDKGQIVFHSHMLGVHPLYRECGLGRRLKLAQRSAALAREFERVTWTFDPLQSTNAHLNFRKLGVVANRYNVKLYGDQSSSLLYHHIDTDRLWVDWLLKSKRVTDRLEKREPKSLASANPDGAEYLIQIRSDGLPERCPADLAGERACVIEIPTNIGLLQQHNPEAAVAWRNATRSAFVDAFAAGYVVDDFLRLDKNGDQIGCYLIIPASKNELD
jgi:predicted GNAT superfamily acetyltransferase